MNYFDQLKAPIDGIIQQLVNKKVDERYLKFGGAAAKPEKEPRVPTDARSEFLANRAMGDWAENLLAESLRITVPELKILHYGDSIETAAGEEGFKEQYLKGLKEVREFGKRPDLLLVKADNHMVTPNNLANLSFADLEEISCEALASIEVRSSKFEAIRYMEVRRQQHLNGTKATVRMSPSFTVKVEDLLVVYRWIERKKIPQAYFQVFFDSVYAINVLDIFRLIAAWEKKDIAIETPAKSQQKATIMIPITYGTQVGRMTDMPRFEAEHKVTELGRHDVFVKPVGGSLCLDTAAVKRVLSL